MIKHSWWDWPVCGGKKKQLRKCTVGISWQQIESEVNCFFCRHSVLTENIRLSSPPRQPCLDQEIPNTVSFDCEPITWALWRPHDSRPSGSQLPRQLQALPTWDTPGSTLPLMHGSRQDWGQRDEEEHVPLVDLIAFLPWICISQCPRGTSFHGGKQCCHAGQLVSRKTTCLPLTLWPEGLFSGN